MNNSIRKKLEDANHELDNPNISLARIKELNELLVPFFSDPQKLESLSAESIELINLISVKSWEKIFLFIDKWQKWQEEGTKISEKELEIMEEFSKNLANYSKSLQNTYVKSDNFSGEERKKMKDYLAKVMKKEQLISNLVKQEKLRRQQQPDQTSNSSSTFPLPLQQLQKQLNDLQKQIQSLLNSQSQNPSDSNQLQPIKEQLTALQNQIQSLEKQPSEASTPASQPDQEELTKLKNQVQQLQKDLQSRQSGNMSNTNSPTPEKGFNWLYVVIPAGVLLVIMGIIIAYLLGKKNKKE